MRRSILSPLLLAPPLLLGGCGGSPGEPAEAAGTGASAPTSPQIEKELRDLVTAVTPLGPTATAGAEGDWHQRRKETFERMRQGPRELGLAALAAFGDNPTAAPDVRSAYLDVGAHCAPEEARPILVELVTTYGEDLGVRTDACRILARTSPESAVELLEPILVTTERRVTYPPGDRMLDAYLDAMARMDRDPIEVLADIVTNLRQDQTSRHLAARRLGDHPGSVGRQALETVLVESLGDNMLRRIACQSLEATLDDEEFCATVRRIFDNESDLNMQQFLADVLETHCL